MRKEVEILKIGSIVPSVKEGVKDTIMVVFNGGPIFDHYVEVLKEKCGDKYNYLRTDKAIVGTMEVFKGVQRMTSSLLGHKRSEILKGFQNDEPKIGFSYGVESWYTSTVNEIIDGNILITRNSVYAIHDISKIREKRLNDLGI